MTERPVAHVFSHHGQLAAVAANSQGHTARGAGTVGLAGSVRVVGLAVGIIQQGNSRQCPGQEGVGGGGVNEGLGAGAHTARMVRCSREENVVVMLLVLFFLLDFHGSDADRLSRC